MSSCEYQHHKKKDSSVVHVVEAENKSCDLYTAIPFNNFKWMMKGSSWITEGHNFYLFSNTQQYLFLQIAYSNLSWPAHPTCQITAKYCDMGILSTQTPNISNKALQYLTPIEQVFSKTAHHFWSGNCKAQKMVLNDEMTSLSVKHVSIQVQDDKTYILNYDDNTFKFNLTYTLLTQPFMIGDGSIYFGKNKTDGFVNIKLVPVSKVSGLVSIEDKKADFEGFGFCVRQFQGVKPYLSASQWDLLYFQSSLDENEMISFLFLQMKTPSAYDDVTFNVGSLFVGDRLIAVCKNNKITPRKSSRDPLSSYAVPSEIIVELAGVTFDSQKFSVTCHASHTMLCTKLCILDSLPYVVRKVIEAFVAKPFVFQWTDHVSVDLSIGDGNRKTVKGILFHELTQLNN